MAVADDAVVLPHVRNVVCALAAGLLLGIPAAVSAATPALPTGVVCADALREQLAAWQALGQMRRAPEQPSEIARYIWPTARIGVWLDLRITRAGHARLARVAPDRTADLTWNLECVTTAREIAPPGEETVDPGVFVDADLDRLVAASRSVVVYVWSPHMPLSVDGVHQASVAAARLSLRFVPLAHPHSDRAYADRMARQAGLPNGAARPVQSIELAFRDVFVHAPSLLLFINGRAAGPAIPGYRDADGYERALRYQLEQKGRDEP